MVAINQASRGNRPHFLADGWRVWTAHSPAGHGYLALFNTGDAPREITVHRAALGLRADQVGEDAWTGETIGRGPTIHRQVAAHGVSLLTLRNADA